MEFIRVRKDSRRHGVYVIEFHRPEKRNAISLEMWTRLADEIDSLERDERAKILVLTGADATAFSAGGDISEFQTVRHDRTTAAVYNTATERATRKLHESRLITVAAIQGVCYGGGMQLASACDIRIGAASASFAITPAKIGAVYGLYETRLLMQIVGESRTKDLLYTGRPLSARDAYDIGFLTICVEDDTFQSTLDGYLDMLLGAAYSAQRDIKRTVHRIADGQIDDDEETAEWVLRSMESPDYKEGIQAFLEKRRPKFR